MVKQFYKMYRLEEHLEPLIKKYKINTREVATKAIQEELDTIKKMYLNIPDELKDTYDYNVKTKNANVTISYDMKSDIENYQLPISVIINAALRKEIVHQMEIEALTKPIIDEYYKKQNETNQRR